MVVTMHIVIFCVLSPCSLVDANLSEQHMLISGYSKFLQNTDNNLILPFRSLVPLPNYICHNQDYYSMNQTWYCYNLQWTNA
jgi:hypothetical protein